MQRSLISGLSPQALSTTLRESHGLVQVLSFIFKGRAWNIGLGLLSSSLFLGEPGTEALVPGESLGPSLASTTFTTSCTEMTELTCFRPTGWLGERRW